MQAPFPAPPPFYKHFTKHNITRLRQARTEAGLSTNSAREALTPVQLADPNNLDILSLPPELRYLIPPAPPADGKWRSFGAQHDLNAPEPTLQDIGIEQLYPDHPSVKLNPQSHLISLARSLLTTFLALVGQLSRDPTGYEGRTKDLETILFNIHDLVNQYRPHQARETLILMMEERIEKLRGETAAIHEAKVKVAELLADLQKSTAVQSPSGHVAANQGGSGSERQLEERRRAKQRAAWAVLEESAASGT